MNTKRQTVWLVSMLSLMVILSAYYLFTDNVDEVKFADDDLSQTESVIGTEEVSGTAPGGKDAAVDGVKDDVEGGADAAQEDGEAAVDGEAGTAEDQEVLKKLEAQTLGGLKGQEFFDQMHMKRDQEMTKEMDRLLDIISEAKEDTALQKAYDDISLIDEQTAKLADLEDKLMKDFENAIVASEQNKWKVIVQSDKLEKSQAVSIIELVMKELNVTADKVSVQYIP